MKSTIRIIKIFLILWTACSSFLYANINSADKHKIDPFLLSVYEAIENQDSVSAENIVLATVDISCFQNDMAVYFTGNQ